jgi:hypothetical protein
MDGFQLAAVAVEYTGDRALPSIEMAERIEALLKTYGLGPVRRAPDTSSPPGVNAFLSSWATDPHDQPGPTFLYWVGHGSQEAGSWLLTGDSASPLTSANALRPEVIAEYLQQRWMNRAAADGSWTVLILDLCRAGNVARKIANVLTTDGQVEPERLAILPVIGASASEVGRFADALEASLGTFNHHDQTIGLRSLLLAIADRLGITLKHLALGPEDVLPNPRYLPEALPTTADSAAGWQEMLSGLDADVRDHFLAKARSTELGEAGWFFVGREHETQELLDLVGTSPSGMVVVTGEPGAGKSAFLGRLVAFEDREIAQGLVDMGYVAPEHILEDSPLRLDAVLHLTGKSPADVRRELQDKVDGLAFSTDGITLDPVRPVTILVDALDEAQLPASIASQILRPLARQEDVCIIVGTRPSTEVELDSAADHAPELIEALGAAEARTVTLHRNASAMSEYARRRLESSERVVPPEVMERVVDGLAATDRPFLFAPLLVREVLAGERVTSVEVVDDLLEKSHGELFAGAVDRLAETDLAAVGLLRALAYAEGRGLPRRDGVWATIASALDESRSFGEQEVSDALESAGPFIVLDHEAGQGVHRLAHRTFAEQFLDRDPDAAASQRSITRSLMAAVDDAGWQAANPYLLTHLSTHAASGGVLERLLAQPGFLLATDHGRLWDAIERDPSVPEDLVDLYLDVVHLVTQGDRAAAPSYLELRARQRGLDEFADAAAALRVPRRWTAPWSAWRAGVPSRAFAIGLDDIVATEPSTWADGRPVCVVGRALGGVEVWDFIRSIALFEHHSGRGRSSIRSLGMVHASSGSFLAVLYDSGVLEVLDPLTGDQLSTLLPSEVPGIRVMCLVEHDGRVVCTVGLDDGSLQTRSLPDLDLLHEAAQAVRGDLQSLTTATAADRTVLFSCNDSLGDGDDDDSQLRRWSFPGLRLEWADRRSGRGLTHRVDLVPRSQPLLGVVSSMGYRRTEVWDLDAPELLFTTDLTSRFAWLSAAGERPLLEVTGGRLTARAFPSHGDWPHATGGPVHLGTIGGQHHRVVRTPDREFLIAADANEGRAWDVRRLQHRPPPYDSDSFTYATVGGAEDLPDVVFCAAGSRIVRRNAATGVAQAVADLPPEAGVCSIAAAEGHVVAATSDGRAYRLDYELQLIGEPVRVGEICSRVALAQVGGRPVIVANTLEDRLWSMRLWDLESGRALVAPDRFALDFGQGDKELRALAVVADGSAVCAAFASQYGQVMVADVTDHDSSPAFEVHQLLGFGISYVNALAIGRSGGDLLLAAAGNNGTLAIIDPRSGEPRAHRVDAHRGHAITEVAFGWLGESLVLASGDSAGVVSVWSPDGLERWETVDVGSTVLGLVWTDAGGLVVSTGRGQVLLSFEGGGRSGR